MKTMISSAILSFVPKSEVMKSLPHGGWSAITSAPTAAIGEMLPRIAATISPTPIATAADAIPTTAHVDFDPIATGYAPAAVSDHSNIVECPSAWRARADSRRPDRSSSADPAPYERCYKQRRLEEHDRCARRDVEPVADVHPQRSRARAKNCRQDEHARKGIGQDSRGRGRNDQGRCNQRHADDVDRRHDRRGESQGEQRVDGARADAEDGCDVGSKVRNSKRL